MYETKHGNDATGARVESLVRFNDPKQARLASAEKESDMMNYGRALKGVDIATAAKRCDMPELRFQNIARGVSVPSAKETAAISKVCGIDPDMIGKVATPHNRMLHRTSLL